MRRLVLIALLTIAGCASNVGPDGLAVGGPCRDTYDCASGSYCLRGPSYPDGTCTQSCATDADCRGAICVEQGVGACLLPCTTDEDCARDGYACREADRHGTSEPASVCVGS